MQQERRQDGYSNKGDLQYIVEALSYQTLKKMTILNTDQLHKVLKEKWGENEFKNKSFLDLGCGDGKYLWQLNKVHDVSWKNILGVTGEDMRGCKGICGEEGFDIR